MKLFKVVTFYLSFALAGFSAELQKETLNAWNQYIKLEQKRIQHRATDNAEYLWADDSPDRLYRLRAGQTVVSSVGASNPLRVPNGLIHHWIGAVLVPNASIEQVLAVLRNYDDYQLIYSPGVASGKLLQSSATQDQFVLGLENPSFLSHSLLEGIYVSDLVRIDDQRFYTVSQTTQMTEVKALGTDRQERLPPDCGSGYIWRLYSTTRLQKLDGAVLVEVEAMALSRDVPASLRWIAVPIIRRVSREALEKSLQNTVSAVQQAQKSAPLSAQASRLR